MTTETFIDPAVITSSLSPEPNRTVVRDEWIMGQLTSKLEKHPLGIASFTLAGIRDVSTPEKTRIAFDMTDNTRIDEVLVDMIKGLEAMGMPKDTLEVRGTVHAEADELEYSGLSTFEPAEFELLQRTGQIAFRESLYPLGTPQSEIEKIFTGSKATKSDNTIIIEPLKEKIEGWEESVPLDYFLKAYALHTIHRQNKMQEIP